MVEHDLRANASRLSRENRSPLCANAALWGPDHALLAGTRERAGTRRGFEPTFARGPAATIRHADRSWKDKVRA